MIHGRFNVEDDVLHLDNYAQNRKGVRAMSDYITFAQLADALRSCGNRPTVADCKGCAFYNGPDMSLCIPKMTERAAQVIDLFAVEKPKKEGEPSDL